MASGPITSWQIDGETVVTVTDFIFLGSKITADGDCSHEIKRCLLLGRKAMTNLHIRDIKKQRHYFPNKGPSSQSYGFSSSHVWMRDLDHKECWAPKNWCFWTVVLDKTWGPLDCKEIQLVNSKGNQTWIFIGRADAEAETPILWKRPWCWGRLKAWGEGDDRGWDGWMASPTQWMWVLVNSVVDCQGGLPCYSPWGCKELDMTERLNWTALNWSRCEKMVNLVI